MKLVFYGQIFKKIFKFHENMSGLGAELFHADGETDRHDEANSRFSQSGNALKNCNNCTENGRPPTVKKISRAGFVHP